MIFFNANTKASTKNWPRMGLYQNTTLRYTPGEDFPGHFENMIGKPKILRCFLTLDDAWDYRTGEYRYDYVLGDDPYIDDPNMYRYERVEQKPSPYGMTFLKFLTSHSRHTEYVMLTIRRYEKEITNGIVSLDQYEEILENLLEHYKEIVPNIRYIEGNECNIKVFGQVTALEYYEIYKRMYTVVNRLNRKHRYEIPLEVGGPTNFGCMEEFSFYEKFLRLYTLDRNPEKRMDFYASHEYSESMTTVPEYYRKHHELIKRLGLPEAPIFLDEYGASHFRPDPAFNQLAATGLIEALITTSEYEDLHIFPWCTYHDPEIQVSYSMFIDFNRSCGYLPTFLGQSQIALSKLYDKRLPLEGNAENRAVVTTDGENYAILATNKNKTSRNIRFSLSNLPDTDVKVETYKVDALHNNCFIDKSVTGLQVTDTRTMTPENGKLSVCETLDAMGFTLWIVKPCK